jgi:hypothetical protein
VFKRALALFYLSSPSLHKGGGLRGWVNKYLRGVRLINNLYILLDKAPTITYNHTTQISTKGGEANGKSSYYS